MSIPEAEYRKRNPWPRMYDIGLDEFRDVTQADVDKFEAVVQAYGKLRMVYREAQEELMRQINDTAKQ